MRSLGLTVFLWLFVASSALADVPARLEYQGYLTDAVGTPIDCQGCFAPYNFKFSIFDAQADGTLLWSEVHAATDVIQGVFRVELGIYETLDAELLAGERWLEIQVNGQDPLVPRQSVISVPYALRAGIAERALESENAASLGGQSAESYLQTAELVDTLNSLGYLPGDNDTLSSLLCAADQIARWDGAGWICSTDQLRSDGDIVQVISDAGYIAGAHTVDTILAEAEVEAFITNTAINLFAGTTLDGQEIATGAHTFDTNSQLSEAEVDAFVANNNYATGAHTVDTTLTEAEVDAMVQNNSYALQSEVFNGDYNDLSNKPTDQDTLAGLSCAVDQIAKWDGSAWICAEASAGIPSGSIVFFAGDCPAGWTDLSASFGGRTLVLAPDGGTVGESAKVGTALVDQGTRTITDVTAHSHSVDPPETDAISTGAHTHTASIGSGTHVNFWGHNYAQSNVPNPGSSPTNSSGDHNHIVDISSFTSDTTGTASVDVTMPYIQLKACQAP